MFPTNHDQGNKLARKLMPNQSIRASQKRSKLQPSLDHHPSPQLVNLVIDCSAKTKDENEVILNDLVQIIDLSLKQTQPKEHGRVKHKQDLVSSNSKELEAIVFNYIDNGRMVELLKKNRAIFSKNQQNNYIILGLNSILNYLEILTCILIPIEELIKSAKSRCPESSSIDNKDAIGKSLTSTIESENMSNSMIDPVQVEQVLINLKIVKYIVVFNNHFNNQHHSIIDLISTFLKQINRALSLINSFNPLLNITNLSIVNSIELVGFPVDFIQPILKKISIKRLSCFAILNSAPGLEKLNKNFKV